MRAIENQSEEAWVKTILKDGTLGDKLAALMLRVQVRVRACDWMDGGEVWVGVQARVHARCGSPVSLSTNLTLVAIQ